MASTDPLNVNRRERCARRRDGVLRDIARIAGQTLVVTLPFLSMGCAKLSVPDRTIQAIREGRTHPCEVVFIAHGILKDFGMTWDFDLRDHLLDHGSVAIVATYFAEPTGTWFDWGSTQPAQQIADLADDLTRLHEQSDCPIPLSLRAVGFSNGCEVLLEAAARVRVARFGKLIFFGSSAFAFSSQPAALIDAGKIDAIHDHWSPLDLVTLLAPLGAGSFGTRSSGPGSASIHHHLHWRYHLPPLFSFDRDQVVSDLDSPVVPNNPEGDDVILFRDACADLLSRRRTRID